MSLVELLVVLIALGVILWAINAYLPMQAQLKQLLNVAVVVIAVVFLLAAFGVCDALKGATVPKL
jgi:hypothetical protein